MNVDELKNIQSALGLEYDLNGNRIELRNGLLTRKSNPPDDL